MKQRIIDRSYVGEVLQRIYESRLAISFTLDFQKGYFFLVDADKRVPLEGTCIEEAVTDLASRLSYDFPESDFAGWWNSNFHEDERSGTYFN